MDVEYELLDKGLIDRDGERCGRVDDLEVENTFDRPPRVVAILAGGGAKSVHLWPWVHRLSLWLHRVLGLPEPVEPVVIPWEEVANTEIDVMLRVSGEEVGLERLNQVVADRLIGRIPGGRS